MASKMETKALAADLKFEIHTIGLTEEEANASLDEHGEMRKCASKGCPKASVMMLIIKKPGSGWGENISSTAACAACASGLERIIAKTSVTHHSGPAGDA